ncbi:MAG: hypothetical protein VYA30_15480 [Myxococcota bacterium]|nr:hypothetical protein [Myxococcota bacterium]
MMNTLSKVFGFACLMVGCTGLNVDRLSLTDPRLPVDARRWVADAEDAVVISRAKRDEAGRLLKAVQSSLEKTLSAPAFDGPQGTTAKLKREQMALSRLDAATAALSLADAELGLSKARLRLIYAETAMRQDIAVYNMPPLQAAVDQALSAVVANRDAHRRAREAELKAADEWWSAWQSLAAKKGDTRPFWTQAD